MFIVFSLLALSGNTLSSQSPRIELFAGYSYLPELDPFVQSFLDSGHGFGVSVSFNLWRHLGLVVDVDNHWWTYHGHWTDTLYRGDQSIRLTYLSFGPRFVARIQRLSAFGMVTFDLQLSHYSEQTIISPDYPKGTCCGGWSRAFGYGIGGGADVSLTNHIAVRVLQINYSLDAFGEGPGRRLRIKSGVVIKF